MKTRDIVPVVCAVFNCEEKQIYGPSRRYARPRMAVYWLARTNCGAIENLNGYNGKSYVAIGRALRRDHSTIIHGAHRIQALMETDAVLCGKIERCVSLLNEPICEREAKATLWAE